MCILHIVFCTVCKYVLSICKLLLLFFCTVWSTLVRISLTKALVPWRCDNKSDLIFYLKKKMDHYDWFCGPEKTPVGGNRYLMNNLVLDHL